MTKHIYNQAIETWQPGDHVQGYVLLTKKELRQDRNGREYLDMEVADRTGSMVAKVWTDSQALRGDYGAHDFVAFRGTVKNYRDQLQLNIDDCRRVKEADRELGFDEARLVPSTREDIDELYGRLEALLDRVERPVLRRLVRETLEHHGAQLREHPAAKAVHHAYRGGLLEHTVAMARLADGICDQYGYLDRDLVLVGVLYHDLGKLRELGAMPVNDYTLEGRMVGHVVLGHQMLLERCAAIEGFPADLRLHLEHLVLSHQGRKEYSSPVEPMTAEAIVLHQVDDLDSKLNQLDRLRGTGQPLQFLKGFGRYVYLGENAEPESSGST